MFKQWKEDWRRKLQADRDYPLQLLGLAAFSFISAWATFWGLMSFESNDTTLALTITLAVQMMIIYLARRMAKVDRTRGKLGLLGLLMIFWLFSSGMATAYWWGMFDADRFARAQFGQQAEALMRPLTDFRVAYADLANELNTLAAYSRQRANEELKRGGTCGDGARRGPGPRQRLRQEDARLFSAHARRFDERASTFGELVARLEQQVQGFNPAQHAEITRQAARVQREALALGRSTELQALRNDLPAQLGKHVNGLKDRRGKLVRCPDARLENGIRAVMQRIDSLPKMPERPIEARSTSRERNTVFLYQQLMTLLTGQPAELRTQDVAMPLIFGFLPDLAILLMALGAGRTEQGGLGGGPRGNAPGGGSLRVLRLSSGTAEAAERMEQEMQRPDRATASLLRRYGVRTARRRSMIMVPENPPADDEHGWQMVRLAEMLEAGGSIRLRTSGLSVRHLKRHVRKQMEQELQGVRRVSLYDAPPLLANLFNSARMQTDDAPGHAESPPAVAHDAANDDAAAAPAAEVVTGAAHRVVIMADDDGHFRPMATFNSRFSTPALIDTGATGISIPHGMAWMMGIGTARLNYRQTTHTANGEARVAPVVLKELCIGGLCVRNVKAHVARPGALDEPLIGMRFLRTLRSFRIEDGKHLILEGEMEEERPAA